MRYYGVFFFFFFYLTSILSVGVRAEHVISDFAADVWIRFAIVGRYDRK